MQNSKGTSFSILRVHVWLIISAVTGIILVTVRQSGITLNYLYNNKHNEGTIHRLKNFWLMSAKKKKKKKQENLIIVYQVYRSVTPQNYHSQEPLFVGNIKTKLIKHLISLY